MRKLKNILFLSSILLFFAFNFQGNAPSNWYQQFLPDINGRNISDIFFLDSLKGWAVTPYTGPNDSVFVLKTTNGGDNWFIAHKGNGQFVGMNKIKFLDQNTGFACGVRLFNGSTGINKTTNGGTNWFSINEPVAPSSYNDMFILNQDTMWLIMDEGLTGGVFRTINGGVNWTRQLSLGSDNPTHIYFYNKDIGFTAGGALYKTTNSGVNWFNTNQTGFGDMQFINETTGWKCYGPIQKTTDGGLNWITLPLPPEGGNLIFSRIYNLHVLNKDTIWGVGAAKLVGTGARGLMYISTNGGQIWGYQLPDTSIHSNQYTSIQFLNKNKGWAYWETSGVRTLSGGSDTTVIVSINQNQTSLPQNFILHQNYPNPFNPSTAISYQISKAGFISIKVYDIRGKEIVVLVNEKKNAGSYEINFNASNLTSGIYFYSLSIDGQTVETKKMMLVK